MRAVTTRTRPAATRLARARAASRNEAARGARAMMPVLAGIAPLGLVVGAAIASSGARLAAWSGTWLVYGASAHLALIDRLRDGSGAGVAILAVLLVNARVVAYSAALAPLWRDAPVTFKATMAATIVDPTFALARAREREPGTPAEKRSFYTGAAATLWFGWMLVVTAGMAVGTRVALGSVLRLTVPLSLTALVTPAVKDAPGRAAAGTAIGVAVAASSLLPGAGLLVGVVAGATAGALVERRSR
jgi:predicted branched-subunit amino acid permease